MLTFSLCVVPLIKPFISDMSVFLRLINLLAGGFVDLPVIAAATSSSLSLKDAVFDGLKAGPFLGEFLEVNADLMLKAKSKSGCRL